MEFDPEARGVLLFGGEPCPPDGYCGDTWLFTGGSWTLLHPSSSPPARSQAAMAYDPADGQMLLFGGTDGADRGDTWTFSGGDWHAVRATENPVGGQWSNMAYDGAIGSIILFGVDNTTQGGLNATWSFSAGAWMELAASSCPVPAPSRWRRRSRTARCS